MIKIIENAPDNVAAFEAVNDVTSDDFEQVVFPHVKQVVAKYDELNYLLVLNTALSDFSAGAWMQDALLGLRNISEWNRVAIVTDDETIIGFTDMFSKMMPGTFRGCKKSLYDEAMNWAAGKGGVE